jgi:hypothetical protein
VIRITLPWSTMFRVTFMCIGIDRSFAFLLNLAFGK